MVFNYVVASQVAIKVKNMEELKNRRWVKLFRGSSFDFPESLLSPWQYGE
jgi:hypothetical protein